jgi:hypothetical protein
VFHEIYTEGLSTLLAIRKIRGEFEAFCLMQLSRDEEVCFSIEKQLSVGGQSSSLLFHVYMSVLDVVYTMDERQKFHFVSPLPVQLKSYIKKRLGLTPDPDSRLVREWKEKYRYQPRISAHRVEAWCLARLARDVLEGSWQYKLPSKEAPLVPWKTINGDDTSAGGGRG